MARLDSTSFAVLETLRAYGVQHAEFLGGDGELSAVTFFPPQMMAEADAARVVARDLADGPAQALDMIRRIREDTTLPELEREELARKLENDLVYRSS